MMERNNGILVAAILGSGIVFLDSTVVNVALPAMGRDLDSSFFGVFEGQSYVYYGYLLTLSSLLILGGALADKRGRRVIFAGGLAAFGLTSVLCGLAPTMDMLILGRVLQGAAGALLIPGSLALITTSFSGEQQGRAFGIWAGASGATAIFGPPLGGALVTLTSWRSVFLINVPLIAIALWATLRYVEESRDPDSGAKFDHLGAVTIVLALGGLTFGTIRGQAENWSTPLGPVALVIGAVALLIFIGVQKRARDPLVPLELFRSRNFTVTNISTFLIYGALYVSFQYLALHLIGTVGYNELGYGLAGLIGPVFLVLFSSRVGVLAARLGPRWFMAVGPAVMAVGLMWFARLPADSEPWIAHSAEPSSWIPPRGYLIDILPGMLVFGIGLVIMVAPLTTALMRSVPPAKSGVASAINNAISRIGPQLGGALLFVAATASFYSALGDLAPAVDTSSTETRAEVAPFNPAPADASADLREAVGKASTEAFQLTALITAGLCAAGAIVNALGIRNDQLYDEAG